MIVVSDLVDYCGLSYVIPKGEEKGEGRGKEAGGEGNSGWFVCLSVRVCVCVCVCVCVGGGLG